jgi:hypothetical protein
MTWKNLAMDAVISSKMSALLCYSARYLTPEIGNLIQDHFGKLNIYHSLHLYTEWRESNV